MNDITVQPFANNHTQREDLLEPEFKVDELVTLQCENGNWYLFKIMSISDQDKTCTLMSIATGVITSYVKQYFIRKPKYNLQIEDYSIDDWVEVECQNGTKKWTEQCKIICIYRDGDGYGVNFHGDHQPVTYDGKPFSLHLMGFVRVIRKLRSSQVIIDFGSGIVGTIEKSSFNRGCINVIDEDSNIIAEITVKHLIPSKQKIVNDLLY